MDPASSNSTSSSSKAVEAFGDDVTPVRGSSGSKFKKPGEGGFPKQNEQDFHITLGEHSMTKEIGNHQHVESNSQSQRIQARSSEDESFVTMEEMNDDEHDCHTTEDKNDDILPVDAALYAQLGYGKLTDLDDDNEEQEEQEPMKRSSKVFLNEDENQVIPHHSDVCSSSSTTKPASSSRFRRLSHRLSREYVRRRSSLAEAMPETPAGWAVLLSGLASAVLGYELNLQQRLSCPPLVFGQCGPSYNTNTADNQQLPLQAIYQQLTATPDALLRRPIKPSLFVGTRGSLASTAAYALLGPGEKYLQFRQVLTMPLDGAKIAIDWEVPNEQYDHETKTTSTPAQTQLSDEQRKKQILTPGGIHRPVVLILTGMNNDTNFGYIKSLKRTFTDRGWIAVAMNFRGCSIPLATPRFYNGAYTGDLRGVVHYLETRLAPKIPLFIVGNSLSANLVTKYLGEEGLNGTLPKCVAGGVSLGNPLLMHINNLRFPWKQILGAGVKKDILLNWSSFRHMMDVPSFQQAIYGVLKAPHLGGVDESLAPIKIRNDSHYPFAVRVGFRDAEEYWAHSSSFKYIKHISVPCLQVVASDDMICYKSFQKKLVECIQNPYVMCVETKCGGHLGWQESPPDANVFGLGTSWADRATADFFGAILAAGTFDYRPSTPSVKTSNDMDQPVILLGPENSSKNKAIRFRSKL